MEPGAPGVKAERECEWYPVCPMKYFYERGRLEKMWVERYCHGDWLICRRYQLEERGEYHSDYLLPDGTFLE